MTGEECDYVCMHCGAKVAASHDYCRQCGIAFRPIRTASLKIAPSKQSEKMLVGSAVMLLALMAIVFVMIWIASPGLGIAVSIAAVPAVIRTGLLAWRRQSLGRPLRMDQQIVSFANSLSAIVVICVTLSVIACITFFFQCIAVLGGKSGRPSDMINVVAIFAAVCVLLAFVPWIVRRWRTDIESDD